MTDYAVRVIGPPEMTAGFALAGLPVDDAACVDDGVALLAAQLARGDIGVLLVDERIVAAAPEALRRRAQREAMPVIVPVPRPRWQARGAEVDSYILDLLQRAIGYRMRLR